MLIDTHSHIYSEEFDLDREEVLGRAETAGIHKILLPAIDKESYDRQEHLCLQRPDLVCQMMGLHPTSVTSNFEEDLRIAHDRLFKNPEAYVAVGEIGLDLYWDTTYRQQQLQALKQQIDWAEMLQKPIVLHVRNAYQEVFDFLEKYGNRRCRGVMHCFGGTELDARRAIEMGFVLGVGGVVTYKNAVLSEIVKAIPLESIVLETDAPYLAPVPHRGKRNESAYITLVAARIAELKECSIETVAITTTATATALFSL